MERLASALASGALAPRLAQGFLAPLEALTGGRAAERLPGGAYVLRPGEALALAPPELDEGELRRAYCEAARSFGYEVPAAGWGPPVPVAVVAEGLGVDPGVLWALLEERAKYGRVALEAVPGPGGVEYTRFLRLRGEDLRGCTG